MWRQKRMICFQNSLRVRTETIFILKENQGNSFLQDYTYFGIDYFHLTSQHKGPINFHWRRLFSGSWNEWDQNYFLIEKSQSGGRLHLEIQTNFP